eukprot:41825-Prorocentrum_minimum.AAC.2
MSSDGRADDITIVVLRLEWKANSEPLPSTPPPPSHHAPPESAPAPGPAADPSPENADSLGTCLAHRPITVPQ